MKQIKALFGKDAASWWNPSVPGSLAQRKIAHFIWVAEGSKGAAPSARDCVVTFPPWALALHCLEGRVVQTVVLKPASGLHFFILLSGGRLYGPGYT